MIHQVSDSHVAAQEAAGFPFLQGIQPTLRALNGLWFHAARRGPRAANAAAGAAQRPFAGDAGRHAGTLRHRPA